MICKFDPTPVKRFFGAACSNVCNRVGQLDERIFKWGFSLGFYLVNVNAFWVWFFWHIVTRDIAFALTKHFGNDTSLADWLLTNLTYLIFFILTFKLVYSKTGGSIGRTLFIQGGGIFSVLHFAFAVLTLIAYVIYKAVKESFVIPNFTVEQIENARDFYNSVSDYIFFPIYFYLIFVLAPLLIGGAVSRERIKKSGRNKR